MKTPTDIHWEEFEKSTGVLYRRLQRQYYMLLRRAANTAVQMSHSLVEYANEKQYGDMHPEVRRMVLEDLLQIARKIPRFSIARSKSIPDMPQTNDE